jgi:hypothetical protein
MKQSDASLSALVSDSAIYFGAVCKAFEQAERTAGSIDYYFNIGGLAIRLCFAGPAMIPFLTPAFMHLCIQPVSTPQLTVLLWDSFSTGIGMPPPPWKVGAYVARGEGWYFNGESIKINYQPFNGTYNMLDKSSNIAIHQINSAECVPQYERGSPLLAILHWWAIDHGRCLVHAGAVGTADGGVLLAGKGGSGKSTIALTCLNSNLAYVSDDYCLISNTNAPYAYSLYCSGKVNAQDIGRFPFLNSALTDRGDPDSGKALYFVSNYCPEKISHGFPIRAILIPQVTHFLETHLKKATPAVAFRAIAPSTIFQLPGAEDEIFRCLSHVVRQVPCYTLQVGTDLSRIPIVISEVLRRDGEYDQ